VAVINFKGGFANWLDCNWPRPLLTARQAQR
jgi:hypothetical protein